MDKDEILFKGGPRKRKGQSRQEGGALKPLRRKRKTSVRKRSRGKRGEVKSGSHDGGKGSQEKKKKKRSLVGGTDFMPALGVRGGEGKETRRGEVRDLVGNHWLQSWRGNGFFSKENRYGLGAERAEKPLTLGKNI